MKLNLLDLLQEFLCDCEFRKLSDRTVNNYKYFISKFIDAIEVSEVEELNRTIIKNFITSLDVSTSTKNTYLRNILVFIHYIETEYELNLNIKVRKLKEQQEIKFTPSEVEVEKLKQYYNNKTFLSCRNKTIIYTFCSLGLRCSELLNLKVENIDFQNKIVTVNRKGNYVQQLPLNKELELQLRKYMTRYIKIDSGYLFSSRSNKRLAVSDIHYILKKVDKDITAHSLRRWCCTNMIKNNIDIILVSRFMNHHSLEITNRYYIDAKATDIKF